MRQPRAGCIPAVMPLHYRPSRRASAPRV